MWYIMWYILCIMIYRLLILDSSSQNNHLYYICIYECFSYAIPEAVNHCPPTPLPLLPITPFLSSPSKLHWCINLTMYIWSKMLHSNLQRLNTIFVLSPWRNSLAEEVLPDLQKSVSQLLKYNEDGVELPTRDRMVKASPHHVSHIRKMVLARGITSGQG